MSVTNGQTTALAAVREQPTALGLHGSVQITGLRDVFVLAERLAQAEGFVPKALLGKPNAIAASILTGIELGMGPMEAMRSLDIVEGKPTMKAEVMLARALRAGIFVEWERSDDKTATIRLERGRAKHKHSFTIEEAARAGLAGKGNWSKYPAAMLRARCVSAALRAFAPDVLGAGVYTPEELEPTSEPLRPEVVKAEPAAILPPPRREVETADGEVVHVPNTFAECTDAVSLKVFCDDKREALMALRNGQRNAAVKRCIEAADACGVDPLDALTWCGLPTNAMDEGKVS